MGTGILIVLFLAVLVAGYTYLLRRAHRAAQANLYRRLMSERVFSESFHASPTPLVLINLKTHHITEVNGTYVQMIGWSRKELLAHTAQELGICQMDDLITRARRLKRNGVLRDYETT